MRRRPPTPTLFPYTTLFRSVVVDVTDNSPADRAGLRRGDVIVQIAGKPVKSPEDVKAALGAHKDDAKPLVLRSEEHTSELQSHVNLVCRLLLEKKKQQNELA